ncbi:MAG: formylmethanofuran dehydrogenase subunit E family protein [Marinilabiliales bacterium]|nr:formylmethanofuran dehydrogenase subunit E family protein [Marinilabiliales bacterium]
MTRWLLWCFIFPDCFQPAVLIMVLYFIPRLIFRHCRQAALKMLRGETVERMQVIKRMPADTSFYMPDLQPFVEEIRNRFGEDEWTSGVIGNELHRHLGVFAIIGVKMGIRAREYFSTGVDEMTVTTHAGSMPPLSCMNDGIQVSTGATPGHGLLTVKH